MNKSLYFAILIISFLPSALLAQNEVDALRYSQTTIGGSARFMAMGGAFSAIGGDMSTLTFNPAGIAVFQKSQLLFTPGVSLQSTTATYNSIATSDNYAMLNIQNAGLILTWKNEASDSLWRNLNFGIVYNRSNNFNSRVSIQGNNSSSSLLDVFASNSNGNVPSTLDPFSTQLAFNVGLLDTNGSTSYFSIIPHGAGNIILQEKSIKTSGSMGETDISFGANYNNKLYLGGTLGIANINYAEDDIYSETPKYTDNTYGLQGYTYTTSFTTRGTGANLKVGAIYRITDWVRASAAIHTPTFFALSDHYNNSITATYVQSAKYNAGTYSQASPSGSFDYNLMTPMRFLGGLAFVIHNRAVVSADYEFVDYSTAEFSSSPNQFVTVNQTINQTYKPTGNIRAGAEAVFYPFSLRLGYAYYGNPYSSASGNECIKTTTSGGLGIRMGHSFIDFAYVLTQYRQNHYLYDPAISNAVQLRTNASEIVFSCGVNF